MPTFFHGLLSLSLVTACGSPESGTVRQAPSPLDSGAPSTPPTTDSDPDSGSGDDTAPPTQDTGDTGDTAPPGPDPTAGTIVVIPDTQNYSSSDSNNAVFTAITEWIVDNRDSEGIRLVVHEGDIVNDADDHEEWVRAKASLSVLDGHVPYALTTGNHDHGDTNAEHRGTLFNNYFAVGDNPLNDPAAGGVLVAQHDPSRLENAAYTFEAGGRRMLVLALEWGPRDEVVAWADALMLDYPDHVAILVTHAYMYYDETRYDWDTYGGGQSWNPHSYGTASDPGGTNDGQELWDKLVGQHDGFAMTFNGHVLGDQVAYLASEGSAGQPVHQMLFNAQLEDQGGDGWIRLVEFDEDGTTVHVRTYSPYRDQLGLDAWRTDDTAQFSLDVPGPVGFRGGR